MVLCIEIRNVLNENRDRRARADYNQLGDGNVYTQTYVSSLFMILRVSRPL